MGNEAILYRGSKQSFDDYNAFASVGEEIQDTADTDILVSKLKSDSPADTLIVTSIQKLSGVTRDTGCRPRSE